MFQQTTQDTYNYIREIQPSASQQSIHDEKLTMEGSALKRRLSPSYFFGEASLSHHQSDELLPTYSLSGGEALLVSPGAIIFPADDKPWPSDGGMRSAIVPPALEHSSWRVSRKRAFDDIECPDYSEDAQAQFQAYGRSSSIHIQSNDKATDQGILLHHTASQWLSSGMQALDAPEQTCRVLTNPFTEVAIRRHEMLKEPRPLPKRVNSYLKFNTQSSTGCGTRQSPSPVQPSFPNCSSSFYYRQDLSGNGNRRMIIPHQPPGLGRKFRLEKVDRAIWSFYQTALCSGRTLMNEDNGWLNQLLPMADDDETAHHALLAFSAGYALEYRPASDLLELANMHYRKASALLSERLMKPIRPGEEDAIIGSLRLMWCDDIVQWELRRPKHMMPRWYEAVKAAKQIMKATDTGHRYWKHENVQYNKTRTSNANMLALIDTIALNVTSLDPDNFEPHQWLLAGSKKDSEKIYGGTGLSPKLLHKFAQITHYCGLMDQDPRSTVYPLAVKRLDEELANLRQWSHPARRMGKSYDSVEALIQQCRLDSDGLATDSVDVISLGAEAWLQAARIYLQFRFFRVPRTHKSIQKPFTTLKRIISCLPCSGPLFTSQSPFFPVFLLGIAAVTPEDRRILYHWFETIVSKSSVRSSVPPVWKALKDTWNLLDNDDNFQDDEYVDHRDIGERKPWWEMLVKRWEEEVGTMSIV